MAQFLDFMDMINGGGAGVSGDEFKGGGLLSDIANSLFSPRGSINRIAPQQRPQNGSAPIAPFNQQPAPIAPMQGQPQQPPVAQGITTPQVQSASLNELDALYQEMVAAGILPPMAPQMRQGPF